MPFAPGQTGNKRGRPPKKRALTEILQKVGGRKVRRGDKQAAQKQVLAEMLWQAAMTGEVLLTSPYGPERLIVLNGDDWFDAVKFIYAQVDGPPKQGIFDEIAEDRDIQITFSRVEGRPASVASSGEADDGAE